MIRRLYRKSRRSSHSVPKPVKTLPDDLDISALRDAVPHLQQRVKADDARFGALDMSIAILREAANLASNVPYMGAVASMIVQIIKIRDVRTGYYFSFLFQAFN